jgi:hypothetical protein
MTDPMEPAKKLMEAFGKQIESLGLHLHTFAILPNPEGPPHTVQAMLIFDGADIEAVVAGDDPTTALTIDERDAFDMLARDIERSSADDKAAEAAEALKKMEEELKNKRGILGDD